MKYARGAALNFIGSGQTCPHINWQGSEYRPVVFTAVDDNSVGQTISGSTGDPTNYYANPALTIEAIPSYSIDSLRITDAQIGIKLNGYGGEVADAQFVNCQQGIWSQSTGGSPIPVENALFCGGQTAFGSLFSTRFQVENSTIANDAFLETGQTPNNNSASLSLTNCILADVTTNFESADTFSGDHNGFYNSAEFGTNPTTNDFYPFQAVGGGSYYLTDDCDFINAGTTNIDPVLLTNLQAKTTCPPIAYTNVTFLTAQTFNPQAQRDTDVPDLGYHYDPLDYSFGGCIASNNLTFTAGAAVGWFRTTSGWLHHGYGIHMAPRVTVSFNGTVTAPTYWVRLNTVQEQDLSGGYGPGGIESWTDVNSPTLIGHFLKCTTEAYDGGSRFFSDDGGNIVGRLTDCEFWSGCLGVYQDYMSYTNCLMWRVSTWLLNGSTTSSYTLRNCTFIGGRFAINRDSSGPTPVSVRDCSFDATTIITTNGYWNSDTNLSDYDYNAYTNSTDPFSAGGWHDKVVTGGFNWEAGPLGNYYLPSSSPLLNAGDVPASQVGLYHFTTQTNTVLAWNGNLYEYVEVPEGTNTVSIGYHYVAVDQYGNPLDSNSDGIPDYIEDANGNGVVDSGEIGWNIPGDLGLKVIITRPRNGSILP